MKISARPGADKPITPEGHARLSAELHQLLRIERPQVVETVSWAAGNGDRSENGDYIYGKKRLREIDRRVRYLTRRLEAAVIVDPSRQQRRDTVLFGATVRYVDENDRERTVTLVGADEIEPESGRISLTSPVGRALTGKRVGDAVSVSLPEGMTELEVLSISYPNFAAS